MNRIILDQVRRRWFMWSLFALVSMTAGLILGIERDIRISAVLYVSISFVAMDWGAGGPRVLLSLPFTARQIGRAYWWTSVGVSTLLFAVFSGLGILILGQVAALGKFIGPRFEMFVSTGPQDKFLGIWLETVLAGALLSGSCFWLMSGAIWAAALTNTGEPWQRRFPLQLYACAFAIASIAGIYVLCKSMISITEKVVIAYLVGFAFSVLGWFRARNLFIDSSFRPDVARAGLTRKKFEPRPGYGGVSYLIIRFCLFYLTIAALYIAMVFAAVAISVWLDHGAKWSDAVEATFVQVQVWIFGWGFGQTMVVAPHLKFLRNLPLTSKQLAATILCMGLLPVLVIGGLWTTFFLIKPGVVSTLSALTVLKYYLLNLVPVCVLITGVIWYNEKHFTRVTAVVLAWIISLVPLIFQLATSSRGGLPMWIVIVIPAVSIPITLLTISRLLERNDMTYRIRWDLPAQWR